MSTSIKPQIILSHVLAEGQQVKLITRPRSNNSVFTTIKDLVQGDLFVYTGAADDNVRSCVFQHIKSGEKVSLNPCLFLDSDRFFFDMNGGYEKCTALIVNVPALAKSLYGKTNIRLKPGTIFTSYRVHPEFPTRYVVTVENGKEYSLSRFSVSPIYDINREEPVEEPVEILPVEEVPVPVEVVESAPVEVVPEGQERPRLVFEVQTTVDGLVFSSAENAQVAQDFVNKLDEFMDSFDFSTEQDRVNAARLAVKKNVFKTYN